MTTRDGLPTMTTFRGHTFNFLSPDPASIELDDIAHGLSQVCRFAGQSKVLYTVAQHSVLVSRLVKSGTGDLNLTKLLQRKGLFHDAAEAYIGDMPSPLKKLLPIYKQIETGIFRAICQKFGLPGFFIPPEVKDVDTRILANEGMSFMSPDWRDAMFDPDPALGTFEAWEPLRAEREFHNRYQELFP